MFDGLQLFIIYTFLIGVIIFTIFCFVIIFTTKPYPDVNRSKKEKHFVDTSGKSLPFPSINDEPTLNLSVVIPAYDEEVRLPRMLDECIEFLENKSKSENFKYEIIVVSDGSKDKTVDVAMKYSKKSNGKIRVLELETNRGKGGAVRLGMQSARGALLLFADADGATRFADFTKLEANLSETIKCDYIKNLKAASEKLIITVGSRAHLEDDAIAARSYFRTILMYGFHFLVWLFAVRGIRDTQCGFKLMTREAARICFASMHVERWAFDVEILYIAQHLKMPVTEVAVNWTEIEGSKVTPVWSWLQMGKDLIMIWLRYTIGAWKLKAQKEK